MTTSARLALHYPGESNIRFIDLALPDPRGHQVLVRIESTGVCRSQLREMAEHTSGGPLPVGHEALGVVESVGGAVERFAPGDRAVLSWVPLAGEGVREPEWIDVELPDGTRTDPTTVFTWGTHTLVDEGFLIPAAPEDTAPALALAGCALITGYGAAVHSGGVEPGNSVAVIGAGGVGLAAVLGARDAGAERVIVVDVDDRKLEFSRGFGATDLVNSRLTDPVEAVRSIVGRLGCPGADVVIDCVGVTVTIAQSVAMARAGHLGANTGGVIVLTGLGDGLLTVDSTELIFAQKRIVGTFAGDMLHPQIAGMLDRIRAGEMTVSALVTDSVPFADLAGAVERLRAGRIMGRALALM